MWSRQRIADDIRDLRVAEGDAVLVHADLEAVGPLDGGAQALVEALVDVLGPAGTLLLPCPTPSNRLGDAWEQPPAGLPAAPGPADAAPASALQSAISARAGARNSGHATHAFVACGAQAEYLTQGAPFHYPLGTGSPLARLHAIGGSVLLVGTGHDANLAPCLAEVWSDMPYIRRRAVVQGPRGAVELEGEPGCRRGYRKLEPILRQARILREGYVGNAPSQSMRIQAVVSMAIAMLRGDPESLLCDEPGCAPCVVARRLARREA